MNYEDDFGDPRGGLPHQGNDVLATKRAPVVAVESGTVGYWTTSRSAGCMLYLHGDSGTTYEYIHLNNDLTRRNDNRGRCVKGVAYAVPDKLHVEAGRTIGYVGDSGDANGLHAHLHFEVHPNGGKAVDPYPYLQKAVHLLAPAPAAGSSFTLKLTGTVVGASGTELTLAADTVTAWPSHVRQSKLGRVVTLTATDAEAAAPGERVVVWTEPAPGTIEALAGQPDALAVDRLTLL